MIHTERYKLFHNSQDFEKILKKSVIDFQKYVTVPYDFFCKNTLPHCINDRTIVILYKEKEPIGYFVMHIRSRKVYFSFSYIIPSERGRGYSNTLRVAAFDLFKNEFDELTVFCQPSNIASLQGLKYLLKRYNCKYKVSEVYLNNIKHEKFEIEKFN